MTEDGRRGEPYQAYSRTRDRPVFTLSCDMSNGIAYKIKYQQMHGTKVMHEGSTTTWRIPVEEGFFIIEGDNLDRLEDLIDNHRVSWIRQYSTGVVEADAPIIRDMRIEREETTDA